MKISGLFLGIQLYTYITIEDKASSQVLKKRCHFIEFVSEFSSYT